MRVADAVRATSVVQRLKVGEKFTDSDGDWEVVRPTEVMNDDAVKVWVKPFPSHKNTRARAYVYDHSAQVKMIHS